MPAAWRAAGLTYNRYLSIAAGTLRRCLKEDNRSAAARHGDMELRFAKWQNGKQGNLTDLGRANTAAMAQASS